MNNMKLIMESWRREVLLKEGLADEIQSFIDNNEFLKGKMTADENDMIQSKKFVLLFSQDASQHIKERHLDKTKPGSLFNSNVDLRQVASKLLEMQPSEQSGGRVKWLSTDVGQQIGKMGVKKGSPEEVEAMQDYQMPDGRKEMVKISQGTREPTSLVNLITAELGQLQDGRKALSLITMFPGGDEVDGVKIPADRAQFALQGLYFVVER